VFLLLPAPLQPLFFGPAPFFPFTKGVLQEYKEGGKGRGILTSIGRCSRGSSAGVDSDVAEIS